MTCSRLKRWVVLRLHAPDSTHPQQTPPRWGRCHRHFGTGGLPHGDQGRGKATRGKSSGIRPWPQFRR
jgi:hypothetical protein